MTAAGSLASRATGQASLASALRLARPSPAVRHGLKFGTAMAASIWIAFASGLDWGLTIWVTVMFVMQPNAGASIQKGMLRVLGSAAAALVSIAIYGLFAQQPPLMLASICAAFAVSIYGMTGPRDQYAWLVFGFTTMLILLKALSGSDLIETLAFERASLTALGVLIVFVADAVFWPVRANEQLRESLAERCRRLGVTLRRHLETLPSKQVPGETRQPPSSPLIQQLGLVNQFEDEIGATAHRAQTLARIALLLEGLDSRARQLVRDAETEQGDPAPPVRVALERLGRTLHAALTDASECLAADRAPGAFAEASGHALAGFEAERRAQLESLIPQAPGERAGSGGDAQRSPSLSAFEPVLRDIVLLLRRLEEALRGLVKQDGESKSGVASDATRRAARQWFRPDPIRLQLALRSGIAGGAVVVAMLGMGWDLDEDLLPMIMAPILAFLLAGISSTRGAATTIVTGLTAGVFLGWLIADLASVFLFTHLDRMPASLVYPFVIAGGAGYLIVRGSPLGPLGSLFGMLVALLPIFIGNAPPHDVDAAYSLVCGVLLGAAAGLTAQRILWPRTAMETFTERAAAQLDLCLETLRDGERGSDRDLPDLVSAYAKQLTLLGQLNAQAHAEPVERALDDTRRAELLALIQDLFDGSLHARRGMAGKEAAVPRNAAAALAPLHMALAHQNEALIASLNAAAGALRGSGPGPTSSLTEASAAVSAQVDALGGHPDLAGAPGASRSAELLAQLASNSVVESQLQIEAWLADWHRADEAFGDAVTAGN